MNNTLPVSTNGRRALVTGITGQDGAYLTRRLLELGYEVHGLVRRSSVPNTSRLDHLIPPESPLREKLRLHFGDLTDSASLLRAVEAAQPDELYNLAAQSHVRVSFDVPDYTAEVDALGVLRLFEAIRTVGLTDKVRFYQASTSELFGKVAETPQKETTPFHPRSPYGVAKLFAFWTVLNHREAYGIYAVNGILFNHESPLRGENFITRKITLAAARIACGKQDRLTLGNLDARRDWGHAADYVEGMRLMLTGDTPDDYVLASGEDHSVREFAEIAFEKVGFSIRWEGKGIDERGIDQKTGRVLISIDPRFFRPAEVDLLRGDSTKAREVLGWNPHYSFRELVDEMVRADLENESNRPEERHPEER